jgi:hypothetical protein
VRGRALPRRGSSSFVVPTARACSVRGVASRGGCASRWLHRKTSRHQLVACNGGISERGRGNGEGADDHRWALGAVQPARCWLGHRRFLFWLSEENAPLPRGVSVIATRPDLVFQGGRFPYPPGKPMVGRDVPVSRQLSWSDTMTAPPYRCDCGRRVQLLRPNRRPGVRGLRHG